MFIMLTAIEELWNSHENNAEDRTMKQAVIDFFQRNRQELVEDLRTLLRQPSVAAQDLGMHECADLLLRQMQAFGMQPELLPTAGYPVIYSKLRGERDRTLLIYGHYDVQPADEPQWVHDPW